MFAVTVWLRYFTYLRESKISCFSHFCTNVAVEVTEVVIKVVRNIEQFHCPL